MEQGWRAARPHYKEPELSYKYEKPADFRIYVDYVHEHLKELLTQYGPISGIWFDPIMGFYSNPDVFPIAETYALIREIQPHCLISFKQGANGDEDFVAPERRVQALEKGGEIALKVWEKNKNKPKEICDTLQPKDIPGNSWGYNKAAEGKHLNADDVMQMLADAKEQDANLLLNTGPLPDGSIHPSDVETLRTVGKRLNS
jgi:alpha-L-fucosidase